jgi:hypothetical protein
LLDFLITIKSPRAPSDIPADRRPPTAERIAGCLDLLSGMVKAAAGRRPGRRLVALGLSR